MSLLDFILNMAGLLLWLNWRAIAPAGVTPAGRRDCPRPGGGAAARAVVVSVGI